MSSPNKQNIANASTNRWSDGLVALIIFVGIVVSAIWVSGQMSSGTVTVWMVLVAATITAIATGFGALPFLFINEIDNRWIGVGNALAAGLMTGASIGLVMEGATLENIDGPVIRLIIGMILGVGLVLLAHKLLSSREEEFSIGNAQGANALQMLMIVGVMTAHSFAEGIGVGVSYGDGSAFGVFISAAIAVHNIPEGLAISLILIPRGTTVMRSALWSMFSSLPQPLMAVPAFLFVLAFRPFLPIGLGLAAGAMLWMVYSELLPEALEDLPARLAYPTMVVAVLGMLGFQYLIG
ncbi:MAG: ZIP family metal transporter [Anaerolineales bacterium]|nr:ZIP family metal transporter [Anaerolineales bacterium]MCB0031357.1 ZIP family metal transporter [Anaerolineales bacterium]